MKITWKHFAPCWPFVRRIRRSLVDSPHKGQWRGALMFFFYLRLNKRLSRQSRRRWFETPLCPLWCHCNVNGFPYLYMYFSEYCTCFAVNPNKSHVYTMANYTLGSTSYSDETLFVFFVSIKIIKGFDHIIRSRGWSLCCHTNYTAKFYAAFILIKPMRKRC